MIPLILLEREERGRVINPVVAVLDTEHRDTIVRGQAGDLLFPHGGCTDCSGVDVLAEPVEEDIDGSWGGDERHRPPRGGRGRVPSCWEAFGC